MPHLARLCILLNRVICGIGRFFTWAAIALLVVIIFDVVSRRFFVLGSTKLQELEWHIHTLLFAFCLGYGYLANTHVRIDLFRDRFPQKVRDWIELLGALLFVIPYYGILFYLGVNFSWDSFVSGEVSSAGTGLSQRWIVKAGLTLGLGILALSGLSVILRRIVILFAPGELAGRVETSLKKSVALD